MMLERRESGEVFGLPIMKFNLTYEGSLPSSGNKPKVQDVTRIRAHFHPQLVDLWRTHPALVAVNENRLFPKTGGATIAQTHHEYPGPILPVARQQVLGIPQSELLDLCENITKHGSQFRPLVRNSYALHCGLKILFLRKEGPGKVYQGGDIDGRMKTLLDALAIPQHVEQVRADQSGLLPLYCLMEDDSMISGLNVESERLWGDSSHPDDYAKLTIEVDVRVKRTTIYNQSFLG
jgi:hypothetical protein